MKQRSFIITSSIIFTLVFIFHLLRLIRSWEVVIGGWEMPMWVSGLAVIIIGSLLSQGYRIYKQQK